MIVKDTINNEILSIDDFYDAWKEAKSRVRFYEKHKSIIATIERTIDALIIKEKTE